MVQRDAAATARVLGGTTGLAGRGTVVEPKGSLTPVNCPWFWSLLQHLGEQDVVVQVVATTIASTDNSCKGFHLSWLLS